MTGRLILAATPIGDVDDASPRLRRALESADVIAAEDTRRLLRLANSLGATLTAPVVAYHDSVERDRLPRLMEKLPQQRQHQVRGGIDIIVVRVAAGVVHVDLHRHFLPGQIARAAPGKAQVETVKNGAPR
ncbi:MAG: hypothetical protein WCG77_09515, partial [Actinomycetes bacterium]